jgi:cytochrome d ubiquinol oxidase subunit II
VLGYALLGSTWLIWKTEGSAQAHARRLAFVLGVATLLAMAMVSAATPFLRYAYWRRWFSMPNVLYTAQVPLLVVVTAAIFVWALRRGAQRLPFLMALTLFVLNFIGLGISVFPYLVPPDVTIWAAAAPAKSQSFMLVGVAITLPLIVGYTTWAYWVFRGKVGAQGYH